jgi:hypothetical protein
MIACQGGAVTMSDKRNKVSVKLDGDIYRLVKTIAAYRGVTIEEYLSEIVGPIAHRDWVKITREVDRANPKDE